MRISPPSKKHLGLEGHSPEVAGEVTALLRRRAASRDAFATAASDASRASSDLARGLRCPEDVGAALVRGNKSLCLVSVSRSPC